MSGTGGLNDVDTLGDALSFSFSEIADLVAYGFSGINSNGILKSFLNQLASKDISDMGNIKKGKIQQVLTNFSNDNPDFQNDIETISAGLNDLIEGRITKDTFRDFFTSLCTIFKQERIDERRIIDEEIDKKLEDSIAQAGGLFDYKIEDTGSNGKIGQFRYVIYVGEKERGRSSHKPRELIIKGLRILAFRTGHGRNDPDKLIDISTGRFIPESDGDIHEAYQKTILNG